ncbi:MAG TPA: hypothetical protein VIO94_17140 [Phenylobacterium sp.]
MLKLALVASVGALVATSALAAPKEMTPKQMDKVVAAAQPANPGGFGQDRAAWIHANSGAEWGAIAATRAGDNGTINNDYKVSHGDLPAGVTPGN